MVNVRPAPPDKGRAPVGFPRRSVRAAAIAALVVALLGIGLQTIRVSCYYIEAAWQPHVSPAVRLEVMSARGLHAADPALVNTSEPSRYLLSDTSAQNIAALLAERSLIISDGLDVATLTPSDRASEDLRSWLSVRFPSVDGVMGRLHSAVRFSTVLPLFLVCVLLALAASADGRRWLLERVPPLSPSAMALFRVGLAGALAWCVDRSMTEMYRPVCYALLMPFATGFLPRLALAGFAAVVTYAHIGSLSDHDLALPIKTLWLMTIVPWGRGPGVDELLRRMRGQAPALAPSRALGLALWIPTAMLGLAYGAAAWAKLDDGGVAWITSGAVRFIFIADSGRAPTAWGRLVASSDMLSVLASASAVALEAAMLSLVVWNGRVVRRVCGVLALALHVGFYLMQGLFWTWWWMLLVAFLPWEEAAAWLQRGRTRLTPPAAAPVAPLSRFAAAVVFLAVLQQPIASVFRYEYSFLFSDFPMYANVYGVGLSKAEFAAFADRSYQPPPLVSFQPRSTTAGAPFTGQLRQVDPDGELEALVRGVARGEVAPEAAPPVLTAIGARYVERFGSPPPIDAFVDTWQFDWTEATFKPRRQARHVATLDLAAGRLLRAPQDAGVR